MPWNNPDNNGKQNDPWGGNSNQRPPDLDKLISDFLKKMRSSFSFKKSFYKWQLPKVPSPNFNKSNKDHHYGISITLSTLMVVWALSGFFIVNPAEEAVVLRFGKYAEVLQPGLHWMARFIDSKYTVDIQKIYSFSLDGDFLTKSSDQDDLPTQYIQTPSKILNDQSKNLVNVELNVQYRISDPRAYLFNIVNPDSTVQEVASGALSSVIGKMKLDDVLTTGRDMLSAGVLTQVKEILKNYNPGVEVLSVTLRKVQAPDQVRRAFSDVNRADQDKATTIQQALAYASKVVPLAQGVAARTLADATAYQQQIVLAAQANVSRYQAIFKVYTQSPEVTRERLYLDTIQSVLSHSTKIVVDNSNTNMLYLPLDKLLNSSESSTSMPMPSSGVPLSNIASAAANASQVTPPEVKNVSN